MYKRQAQELIFERFRQENMSTVRRYGGSGLDVYKRQLIQRMVIISMILRGLLRNKLRK